jgi:hypothetical protein
MNKYLAYIDESGDPIIADGASETLFLGAIVLSEESLPALMAAIQEVRKTFGLRELKSNQVSNFERRFAICKELLKAELKVLTIWVNKQSLRGEWFRRKQTLYKYVQRLLNHELYRLFSPVQVTIDRYGSPQYQQSLSKYLEDRLQGELFEPHILIGIAKESDLIQVCDFLSGSLRKSLEGDFEQHDSDRLLGLIQPVWPVRIKIPDEGGYVKDIPAENSGKELLACMEEARRYLDNNVAKTRDPKVRTLEYLYYSAIHGSNEYIYTQEVLGWLNILGLRLSEEQFRNEVTASLRDEGLIIAATRKGIKIPRTADDFREYVAFSVHLVLPVLKRLKKAIVFVSTKTMLTDSEMLLSDEMRHILEEVDT